MHDIRYIRENPDAFDAALARRGLNPRSAELLVLDADARKFTHALNDLQERRNAASKLIGQAKAKGDEAEFNRLRDEVESIKAQMPTAEAEVKRYQDQIRDILAGIPNLPAGDVPEGEDEKANVEVRKWGEPRRLNNAKEHFDIGEALGQMDFETAAKMSGARFVLLKGQLARLERAIASFMLDLHTGEFGYTECNPPLLVRDTAAFGTGQLPKFDQDLYHVRNAISARLDELFNFSDRIGERIPKDFDDAVMELVDSLRDLKGEHPKIASAIKRLTESEKNQTAALKNELEIRKALIAEVKRLASNDEVEQYLLIPTAELPLTNIVADDILDAEQLPLRFTAWTPCFRSEAGSAGRDTRGMIRLHQFSKVELVSITAPEKSNEEHERMTQCAEEVLKRLDLPFRTMVLSTGDMGFSARKTYDIEVWLPGQGQYREISSCSNCGDFQARRMNARFRAADDKKKINFVHTLNGSGLAVGRTLVAILENYQQADGSVAVPDVLRPYMGGIEVIGAVK